MIMHTLTLSNFRNHKNFTIDFNGDSVLIVGPNGSGKSNILEAIHYLSTTKSLRVRFDKELISHNENIMRIEAGAKISGDLTNLELVLVASAVFENAATKKVKINKVSKTLQKFAGTITSVLFSPPDIELFSGPPSRRRRYMDQVLYQTNHSYKRAHAQYTRVLKQRNKVLWQVKEKKANISQLDFWNAAMIRTASILHEKRQEYFDFINANISRYAKELNGTDFTYDLIYTKSELSNERLQQYIDREIAARTTLLGPHRDDFRVVLSKYDIATFGSRGQQRSTLLALKLCELDFITQKTGQRPVLLLDDIFSELDEQHRKAVTEIVGMQQTIITSADAMKTLPGTANTMKVIKL